MTSLAEKALSYGRGERKVGREKWGWFTGRSHPKFKSTPGRRPISARIRFLWWGLVMPTAVRSWKRRGNSQLQRRMRDTGRGNDIRGPGHYGTSGFVIVRLLTYWHSPATQRDSHCAQLCLPMQLCAAKMFTFSPETLQFYAWITFSVGYEWRR